MKFSNLYNEIGKTFSDLKKASKTKASDYRIISGTLDDLYSSKDDRLIIELKDTIDKKTYAVKINNKIFNVDFYNKDAESVIEFFLNDIEKKNVENGVKELSRLCKNLGTTLKNIISSEFNDAIEKKELNKNSFVDWLKDEHFTIIDTLEPLLDKKAENFYDISFKEKDGNYWDSNPGVASKLMPAIVAIIKNAIKSGDAIMFSSSKGSGEVSNDSPRGRMYKALIKYGEGKIIVDTDQLIIVK